MASQDIHATLFLLVCMRIRFGPLLTIRQRDGQSPSEMAVGSVEKDVESQRHHTFMVCYARVWIGTPTVRLVLRGNAAVQFFDSIQQLLHNERGLTC